MPRLVVVSNRVGVPDGNARAGGLEVAIRPTLRRRGGLWFGWSGRVADEPGAAKTVEKDATSYITIDLKKDDYDEFYNGFANRVLWPILHYRLDLAEFTRRDLGGYFRVNDYFAKHLEPLLRPDDVIWVHDYHLIPLAKALRARGHKNRIGFFIHIPFPPPEILTALAATTTWLIPALCHYDVVGFQTEIDAGNFCRYVANECGLPWAKGNSFHFGNRIVQVGTFPVGVESEAFSRLARRAIESAFVREVVDSLSGRAMIIGVDRLDYTKGLPERMDAFERFLGKFPDWRGKVTYLQITPRSRSGIPEYNDISRKVGEAVGRINGAYGEASMDAAALHQQGAQPLGARRTLSRRPRRPGHAVARRHEPGRQGIRRGAGPERSRRADTVALRRRRPRVHGGAAGQSVRLGRRRRCHQPGARHAARRTPRAPRHEFRGAGAQRPVALGRALPGDAGEATGGGGGNQRPVARAASA